MLVRMKKLDPNATLPSYARSGDAGLDITATDAGKDNGQYIEYSTGIAVEIPLGYVGLLFPRSSISNYSLLLSNSVGVLDSGYRGEIRFRFKHTEGRRIVYLPGERIGQLLILPYPTITPLWANSLEVTERGEGGYGSTG